MSVGCVADQYRLAMALLALASSACEATSNTPPGLTSPTQVTSTPTADAGPPSVIPPTAEPERVPPPAVPQPITGEWSGLLRIAASSDTGWVGEMLPFDLRIDGTPSAYTGHVRVGFINVFKTANVEFDLGGADVNGFAELKGTRRFDRRRTYVDRLVVRSSTTTGLEGVIHYGDPALRITAEIVSASGRSTPSSPVFRPGPFEGTWRVSLTQTKCAGDCRLVWMSGDKRTDPIFVSQVGSSLLATWDGLELDGSVTDADFTLNRTIAKEPCPGRSYDQNSVCHELFNFRGSLDADGSIVRGTIDWHRDGVEWSAGKYDWTVSFTVTGTRTQ
jgi:hypothetical protein